MKQLLKEKKRSARLGTLTFAVAALVLTIVVLVNVLLTLLPATYTEFDLTTEHIYTLTDTTKNLVSGLTVPVEMYVIAETGQEDAMLRTTLDRYRALSPNLTVTYVDPLLQPDTVKLLTNGEMTAFLDEEDQLIQNSLIVVGPNRYKAVSYLEIGYTEYSPAEIMAAVLTGTTAQGVSYYNAEMALTAAIDYVMATEIPNYYVLTGHEEETFTDTVSSQIGLGNIHLASLDLVTATELPADAHGVIIYSPKQDYNTKQIDLLRAFLKKGGDLVLMTDYAELSNLPNLLALMQEYGVTAEQNIVYATDAGAYMHNQYLILPALTSTLTDTSMRVLLPNVHNLTVAKEEEWPEGVKVTKLFETVKDTTELRSIGDEKTVDAGGEYVLGVSIQAQTAGGVSKMIWIATPHLVTDRTLSNGLTPNQAVSGNNQRYFLSAMSWVSGKEVTVAIEAVRLTPVALSVTQRAGLLWAAVLVFVVPGAILTAGILYHKKRRKR